MVFHIVVGVCLGLGGRRGEGKKRERESIHGPHGGVDEVPCSKKVGSELVSGVLQGKAR